MKHVFLYIVALLLCGAFFTTQTYSHVETKWDTIVSTGWYLTEAGAQKAINSVTAPGQYYFGEDTNKIHTRIDTIPLGWFTMKNGTIIGDFNYMGVLYRDVPVTVYHWGPIFWSSLLLVFVVTSLVLDDWVCHHWVDGKSTLTKGDEKS